MRSKLSRYSFAFLTSLALIACSKVPEGILKEKEMQAVMVDVYLAEAMIGTDYLKYKEDASKQALYESVFRKHNTTQAVYDSSIVWYGKNLKIYMEVYDGVLAEIDSRTKALGDVQANAGPATERDSLNIWPRRPFITFEGVQGGLVSYQIKPEVPYGSGSTFVLGLNVWGIHNGMKHYPEIRLSVVQLDTTVNVVRTITRDGYHQVVLRSLPARQVQQVYGYIRMLTPDDRVHKVYVDSLTLMKYNYGTEVITPQELPADTVVVKGTPADSVHTDSMHSDSMLKKRPLRVSPKLAKSPVN